MNIVAYKKPGEKAKIFIAEDRLATTCFPDIPCFIVSPFGKNGSPFYYPLKQRIGYIPNYILASNGLPFSQSSTKRQEHVNYINSIKESIESGKVKKVVAARKKVMDFSINLHETFKNLCVKFPEAYVFLFSIKGLGTWIGASPELLLESKDDTVFSMALAGTRKAGTTGGWSEKDIREQEIVTGYIRDVFQSHGVTFKDGPTITRRAGNIEHILTPIEGKPGSNPKPELLLASLSPTPALAGFPKDLAIDIITKFEGERNMYGGYCGLAEDSCNFTLNVILRCAFIPNPRKVVLYAGGGIIDQSDSDSEWEETERKLATMQDNLIERKERFQN